MTDGEESGMGKKVTARRWMETDRDRRGLHDVVAAERSDC